MLNMKTIVRAAPPPSTKPSELLVRCWKATNPRRSFHTSRPKAANPLPITTAGPPPSAPIPAASQYGERADRRRRQAELLKRGQDLRAGQTKPGSALKKRFWKDVNVQTGSDGAYTILLDTRPVRNPSNRMPLTIPPSKPHLATAIALEWDLVTSAQQALRSHLIPLTSIASRAHGIAIQDTSSAGKVSKTRSDTINTLMRYLDTDTLLCWAPEPVQDGSQEIIHPTLRELQIQTAQPIIAYLTSNVWPGIDLNPTFDSSSIVPTPQAAAAHAVIKGWMTGLPAWELAGLERAVLAGKSLCIAARLVCEWSEVLQYLHAGSAQLRFGVEQAAEACSLEVRWQTGRWGEVEDTHDVDREDLTRQFGSTILLVSGTPKT